MTAPAAVERPSARPPAPVFTVAFLAAIGRGVERALKPVRQFVSVGPVEERRFRNVVIRTYGVSQRTLPPRFGLPAAATFTGRPYPLGDGPSLPPEAVSTADALDRLPARLDGKFAVCLCADDVLYAATDLIGAGGLLVYEAPGCVCVAGHLGLLLRSLRHLPPADDVGCLAALSMAGSVDGSTPFQGVRRLRSCERIHAAARPQGNVAVSRARYADLPDLLATGGDSRSWSADLACLDERLAACAERERLGERPALMLSSGRDSQAVAQAFHRAGRRLSHTVTYGSPAGVDVRLGGPVATGLGTVHRSILVDPIDYGDTADVIVEAHGGLLGLQVGPLSRVS